MRTEAEDGSLLPISVDGGVPDVRPSLDAGTYTLSIMAGGPKPVISTLIFTPRRLDPAEPLPALPEAELAGLPQFPILTPRDPRALDLERGARATYLVQADKPALYRLESRGLLATEGNVRTRTVTSFDRASENGTGRNFLVLQYLREGDYQLTVQARGLSRGHLGVALSESPLTDGGLLSDGIPARATLGPGEAVLYRFTIPAAADYRIQALGLGRTFRCRLEDADGWPVEKPNVPADFVRRLEPGSYRLVLLPDAVGTRAVTSLAKIPEPVRLEGHGPHTLVLDRKVAHTWTEPEGTGSAGSDAARPPDRWEFSLPAPIAARLELTGEMQGVLRRLPEPPAGTGGGSSTGAAGDPGVSLNPRSGSSPGGITDEGSIQTTGSQTGGAHDSTTTTAVPIEVATLPPGRGWEGKLDAGRYSLETVCSRRNNRAAYEVAVWSAPLVDGLTKTITAPGSLELSVGREALVELTSSGAEDVRARLLDAGGRTIAANDDRPDDWNFRIAEHLAPGTYRLKIDPVGKRSAETKVSMLVPAQSTMAPLVLPARREMTLGPDIKVLPLEVSPDADLLVVSAHAAESLALTVERSEGSGWRTVGTASGRTARLEAPILGGSLRSRKSAQGGNETAAPGSLSYRLRLWSIDRRGSPAVLTAVAVKTETFSEARLGSGLALRPIPGIEPPVAAGAIRLDKPGTFRLRETPSALRVSDDPLHACAATDGGIVSATGERLYLAADAADGGGAIRVKATRVRLGGKGPRTINVRIDPASPSIVDIEGGQVLVAIVRSLSGQPGARITGPDVDPSHASFDAPGSWTVGPKSAVAVWLGTPATKTSDRKNLTVWNAGGGNESLDARVETFSPPWGEPGTAGPGITSGTIEGKSARARALGEGSKKIRLVLDDGTLAVLADDRGIVSTHWGAGAPLDETLQTTASRLVFIRTKPGTGRYTFEMYPLALSTMGGAGMHERREPTHPFEGALLLATAHPYESLEAACGTLRLRVSPASMLVAKDVAEHEPGRIASPVEEIATVHVRGARSEPVLVRDDGTVGRGEDIPLGKGGATLLVPHDASWIFAWTDRPGGEARDLWGPGYDDSLDVRDVAEPALLPLGADSPLLRFNPAQPVIVHLRVPGPAITILMRGSGPPEVRLHESNCSLDAWLPAGPSSIRLRSPGRPGVAPSGNAAEVSFDTVTPIREGLGPEVLLPAGASRTFSFSTTRKGAVGLGVRASSDLLACELQDASGHALANGFVMMRDLDPGTYLLFVRVPAGANPVRLRPALAGVELPDTGPPAEVVRAYIEGRSPSETPPAARARPRLEDAEREEPGENEGPEGTNPEEPSSEEGD